jgi:hypothetical protein
MLAVLLERLVALLDLIEHVVEPVDEFSDLVVAGAGCAPRVVAVVGNGARGLREL